MPSLASAGHRFRSELRRTDGLDFLGTIAPEDGEMSGSELFLPRLMLRVSPDCLIRARDLIIDPFGRTFLVAEHAASAVANLRMYRTFQLFEMTRDDIPWKRNTTTTDALTGLAKGTGEVDLGPLTGLIEPLNQTSDPAFRVREEMKRLITGAAIQLNDKVDDMVVKRIDQVFGVYVAEIQ